MSEPFNGSYLHSAQAPEAVFWKPAESFRFVDENGTRGVLVLHRDGRVEVGAHLTPDEAGQRVFEMLRDLWRQHMGEPAKSARYEPTDEQRLHSPLLVACAHAGMTEWAVIQALFSQNQTLHGMATRLAPFQPIGAIHSGGKVYMNPKADALAAEGHARESAKMEREAWVQFIRAERVLIGGGMSGAAEGALARYEAAKQALRDLGIPVDALLEER